MKTQIHRDLVQARRERFVTEYLSCGIGALAFFRAGYGGDPAQAQQRASSLLRTRQVQKLLQYGLPNRNPTEMARVYGEIVRHVDEAKQRYESLKKIELETPTADVRQHARAEFENLRLALQLMAKCAGLLVSVRLKFEDKQENYINLIRKIEIVTTRQNDNENLNHDDVGIPRLGLDVTGNRIAPAE